MYAAISASPNLPRTADQRQDAHTLAAMHSPRQQSLLSCSLRAAQHVGDAYHVRLSANAIEQLVASAAEGQCTLVTGQTLRLECGSNFALHLVHSSVDAATDYVVQRAPGHASFVGTCAGLLEEAGRVWQLTQSRVGPDPVKRKVIPLKTDGSDVTGKNFNRAVSSQSMANTSLQRACRSYHSRTVVRRDKNGPEVRGRLKVKESGSAVATSVSRSAGEPCESSHSMSPSHEPLCEPYSVPSDRARLIEDFERRYKEYDELDRWVEGRLAVFRNLEQLLSDPATPDQQRRRAVFRVALEQRRLAADPEYTRRLALLESAYADVFLLRRRLTG